MKNYEKGPLPRELFGEGASKQTGKRLKALGAQKTVVVTDKGIVAAGLLEPIVDSIKAEGIDVAVFDGIHPDPSDKDCVECSDFIKEFGADSAVALGGGSPIDTTKVAAIISGIDEEITSLKDYSTLGTKMTSAIKRRIKLIYIPTTSGTGAESTLGGMIIDSESSLKIAVFNESMMPDLVIIDPELTYGMPAYPTAYCGLDVLSHCVERILGPRSHEFMEFIEYEAVERAWKWLPVAVKDPGNKEARNEMAWASHQALCHGGAGTGHCVAHTLGGVYHEYKMAHGLACAISLPSTIRWHAETREKEIRRLAHCFGIPEYETEDAVTVANRVADAVVDYYKACGLTTLRETFKQRNIPDDYDTFISKMLPGMKTDVNFHNYQPPIDQSDDEIIRLLDMVWND